MDSGDKMKNIIKLLIFILIMIFIVCNVYKIFIKERYTTYKIDNYSIEEHYYLTDYHYYDIVIKNKNNKYVYTLKQNFHKKNKIIKNINTYKSNDVVCIIPEYKKEIQNEIYCNKNNQQASNYYLLKNKDFKQIINKAKKYNIILPSNSDTKYKYKQINTYRKNIEDNTKYILWNYKGIYIASNSDTKYVQFFDYDLYDNIMSTVVGDYYVLFENSSVKGIEKIYYYNLKKEKLKIYKPKEIISKDSYINGVVDNYIYVTDKRNKKQYKINIKQEKIEEIDNNQTNYIVYENGKIRSLNKSDFFIENQLYDNKLKKTDSIESRKEGNYYYYLDNNTMYKSLKNSKNKEVLFSLEGIVDWYLNRSEIVLISSNTLYSYNDIQGLRKIITSNELIYNYKNIYKEWKD